MLRMGEIKTTNKLTVPGFSVTFVSMEWWQRAVIPGRAFNTSNRIQILLIRLQ
jgi:hypothetical protein